MKIGNIDLGEKPLFLAPMEDVTDPSFRIICKEFGADFVTTEFVPSEAVIRNIEKTKKKLIIVEKERPVAIQIYGHDLESMIESAKIVEEAKPDIIDLNFGCPVKKIANRGAGAGMLKNIPLMIKIIEEICKVVKTPVTVKTRLGWDETDKPIKEIAEKVQDAGAAAIAIHGRTRSQMYRGKADWTLIKEIKENNKIIIPVIGNGDISSPEGARAAFENYKVDGIMIGRASIGRPWIFKEIKHYLNTGEILPEFSIDQRVDLAKHQLMKSIKWKGEKKGLLEMRRHYCNYFKGLPNFKDLRLKLVTEFEIPLINEHLEEIRKRYSGYNIE